MAIVLSFQMGANKRKECDELDKLKRHFMNLLAEMTINEKSQVIEALNNSDVDRYFELTNPVIMRMAIREVNS